MLAWALFFGTAVFLGAVCIQTPPVADSSDITARWSQYSTQHAAEASSITRHTRNCTRDDTSRAHARFLSFGTQPLLPPSPRPHLLPEKSRAAAFPLPSQPNLPSSSWNTRLAFPSCSRPWILPSILASRWSGTPLVSGIFGRPRGRGRR